MVDKKDIDALEALIDQTSLSSVFEALSEICNEKAEHLQANWQEKVTSPHVRFWSVWSTKLMQLGHAAGLSERELGTYRGPA